MIFFFKPKKIHLDCFTNRNDVYSYFPIVESSKAFPDWWKKLPKSSLKENTMKNCAGFTDYYANSISLRLWSDLLITLINDKDNGIYYEWKFSDKISTIVTHTKKQYGNFLDETNQQHLKIGSPWQFSCKEDLQFMAIGNPWNEGLINRITILNGSLNFKYQNTTNINIVSNYPKPDESSEILLESGINLYNFFPLSERPIEIHNHLVSNEEYNKLEQKNIAISFVNKYVKTKKIIEQDEIKCPFGFKK
jgi:hypothetical protein